MDTPVRGQVRIGSYVNSVTERWAWFLPSTGAGICVQFLGIWLTLALPRIWTAGYVLYRRGTAANAQLSQAIVQVSEHESHDRREHVPDAGSFALDRIWNAGLPPNRLAGGALPKRETNMVLHDLGLALISIAVFILVIVLGTLTTLFTGDSVGLAQSNDCGYYRLQDAAETPAFIATQTQLQINAASYAQSCYAGRGITMSGCNLFARQAIPYNFTQGSQCPFRGEMCLIGDKGAIKFFTGPVPAQVLGFNTGKHLEFQRTTTFAPLVKNDTFVEEYRPGGSDSMIGYQFLYGWTSSPSLAPAEVFWTYDWSSAKARGFDNTYGVGVVQEGPYDDPIPELQSSPGQRLTILFVSNRKLRYAHEIDDPLFQAHHMIEAPVPDPDLNDEVWWIAGPDDDSPRVLACVDEFIWRDTRNGQEWNVADSATSSQYSLLPLSLQVSTIYDIVSYRLALALNASSQTSPQSFFGVLTSNQWEVEARQLFEVSLARAQFETHNMALGLYAGLPGYIKSNDSSSSEICQETYLVTAPGYINVYAAPWLTIFLICLLIIVVTFPTGTREHEKLLFERLPESFVRLLASGCVTVVDGTTGAIDWISKSTVSCLVIGWKILKNLAKGSLALLTKVRQVTGSLIWKFSSWVIRRVPFCR